jgi:PAS domain S-box-containing protein
MVEKPSYEELEKKINELEEIERKYRKLFESELVGIYRTRIEDGKLLAANKTLAKMLSYDSVDTFINESVSSEKYVDPKRMDELFEKLQEFSTVDGFEIEMIRKDGTSGTFEISSTIYPERGYIEGIIIDISRRKQAEIAVKESAERYRTFFEKGTDGIVIIDPQTTKPIEFNDQACRQLGYSRQEFALLHLSDIEAKEKEKEIKEHINKILTEGFDDFETVQRTKQGELRNVRVIAQIIHVLEKEVYHCIWRDITKRKQAEKEQNRLITELKEAILKVKTLSGLLPICSSCKRIRDDEGYWNQIESYISQHSNVDFTHGLCPKCMDKMYAGEKWYQKIKKKRD